MTLHLIRHGKTVANESKLYCGMTDLALSRAGVQELLALKEQINYPIAEVYVVSGLMRTVQTANILFNAPALCTISELVEIHFGDFEMRGYEELRWDQTYQDWLANMEQTSPPGGESKQAFIKRVVGGILEVEHLCKLKGANNVMVVTHGGVIASLMEHYFSGEKNFYQWQPECGRGYTLYLGEGKRYVSI